MKRSGWQIGEAVRSKSDRGRKKKVCLQLGWWRRMTTKQGERSRRTWRASNKARVQTGLYVFTDTDTLWSCEEILGLRFWQQWLGERQRWLESIKVMHAGFARYQKWRKQDCIKDGLWGRRMKKKQKIANKELHICCIDSNLVVFHFRVIREKLLDFGVDIINAICL